MRKCRLALTLFMCLTLILCGCTKESANVVSDCDEKPEIVMWMDLNKIVSDISSDFNEIPLAKALVEKSGINVRYIHPPAGEGLPQLEMLIASDNLPDMISYAWYNFSGGMQNVIDQGYIERLNDLIEAYSPNLKNYLGANPDVDKTLKTDKGDYYVYPFIRGTDELTVYAGPYIRKDWLDELGLEIPETIDEWEKVLIAFRDEKGATAPLNIALNAFGHGLLTGAFGIKKGFLADDAGKVIFGPITPEYKEFLTLMRKWYAEGLLDKNFASPDRGTPKIDLLNGKSGIAFGPAGSAMGVFMVEGRAQNPDFTLAGIPYPSMEKGGLSSHGQKDFRYVFEGSVAISAKSEHKELCARFLDFGYSEEGHMLYNFGIEGESYEIDGDGYPRYTDFIMNNPDGLTVTHALGQYTMSCYSGPIIQDERYIEQYYRLPEQRQAIERWLKTDVDRHILPPVVPNTEETLETSKIMNGVYAYVDDMICKFVMGVEPLSEFDKYVEEVNSLGVQRAIEIKEQALDRYRTR